MLCFPDKSHSFILYTPAANRDSVPVGLWVEALDHERNGRRPPWRGDTKAQRFLSTDELFFTFIFPTYVSGDDSTSNCTSSSACGCSG
jgi:hypothetical protein